MKFINTTKNSVQLEDVGIAIPYINEQQQEIDFSFVQKSRAFQKMVHLGAFKIIEIGDNRLEKNLKYVSDNYKKETAIVDKIKSGAKTEVVIRGHFYDHTGYAKVNRNLAFCLHRKNCLVRIDPVNNQNHLNEVETKVLSLMRKPVGERAILIDSVVPTQAIDKKDCYSILYTTAESNRVPQNFVDIANTYDELWVTSNFCKQSFIDSGYKNNIIIAPPIVNPHLYKKTSPLQFRAELKSFKFLSVQTFGYRKGTDALLHSFCKAFTQADDVCLVLLINERSTKQQNKIRQSIDDIRSVYGDCPQICVTFKNIPEYLMPSFYSTFDAFVLTSRGEGFGLPLCEAALCGLPIVSVNYGGPTDFLNEENSCIVNVDEFEFANEGATNVYYWDKQAFPKLGHKFTNQCAEALQYFVRNYDTYIQKNNVLKNFIHVHFSGEEVGKQIKDRLDDVYRKQVT